MSPTRVLHLIGTSGRGGSETVVAALATRAELHGIQPEVGLLVGGWLADRLSQSGVPTHYFQKSRVLDWKLMRDLARFIRASKQDVVHCHDGLMSIHGCLASRLVGVPSVPHVHGLSPALGPARRRFIHRIVWRAAARIVGVSNHVARELVAMGASAAKIRAIPNGVDMDGFRRDGETSVARQAFGLRMGTPVLGVVSRLYSVKGVDLALESFAHVARQLPDAHLLIAGRGPERHLLESRVRQLSLDDRVHFLGHVTDVPQVLAAMDVVLVTSRSEAFSLSSVEAMAAARPVIAWDHEGPAEIVVDGETGRLVPPFDTEALASGCIDLLTDPARARSLGQAGRVRAERLYSLEVMLERWQQLYSEVARDSRRSVAPNVGRTRSR